MNRVKRVSYGLILCILSIVLSAAFIVFDAHQAVAQKKDLKKIRREVERRYLSDSDRRIVRHKGDYRLDRGEELDANLVVTDGNAEIEGKVLGTVVAIDGDIEVSRTGTIRGDAIAVSGDIITRSGSVIIGDEIHTSWRNFVDRSARSYRSVSKWEKDRFEDWWDSDVEYNGIGNDFLFRYNRVEGLFLGARFANPDWEEDYYMHLYAEGGYGFKSDVWRYNVGLERGFFNDHRLTMGVKAYDLTDSDDFWRIGLVENWLAALFIKEDFFDYYTRRGFTGYVSQQIDNTLKFQLEYRTDTFESMKNNADWTVFGGSKEFRPNPQINEGDLNSINFSARLDTRNSSYRLFQGWFVKFDMEYTSPDLDSDFDYERYILDARCYLPLSRYDNLNMRLWLGSSRGSLPVQRGFYLGGIGTLRGLKYKEYAGTSMAMGNIEYVFDPGRILTGPPSWLLEDFKLAFFADAGVVDMVEVDDFSDMLNDGDWMHDAGFGIMTQDEEFRVDFAWRTDVQGEPVRITFRLNRAF